MNNLIWRSVTCRPGKKSVLPKGKTEPCSRRRYRQTRPEGRSPPLRGCLRSGYARPSTPPLRHSHPVCRAILTLIVALDLRVLRQHPIDLGLPATEFGARLNLSLVGKRRLPRTKDPANRIPRDLQIAGNLPNRFPAP